MAVKTATFLTSGTNGFLNPVDALNAFATDTVAPGIVGSYTSTSGVAPTTGSLAVNAQGAPNMTVAVTAGTAYLLATPSGGDAQMIRIKLASSENVTILSNASGSTKYDFVYAVVDAAKLNNPAVDGTDVFTLTTQRSNTSTVDSNGALANALCIAIVTVVNGAVAINNADISDYRIACNSEFDGWRSANESHVYASATTVTVPSGALGRYSVGDKYRIYQNNTRKYFYIVGVVDTLLTITGGSDYTLTNSTINNPCFSKRETPVGFPQYFNFTPVWTSSGSAPSIGNGTLAGTFAIVGKLCSFRIKFVGGSTTTWGTGSYYIDLPIAGYSGIAANDGLSLIGYAEDNAVAGYSVANGRMFNTAKFYVNFLSSSFTTFSATAPFTWGTGDYWSAIGSYPIA